MTRDCELSDAPAEIVQDDQLGGEPRLSGHRIGVFHIWVHYRRERTVTEIAEEVYPHLRVDQVEAAVDYARTHPDEIAALQREHDRRVREHRRAARERKQLALRESCPTCGGQLTLGDELPLALVRCVSCGEEHAVRRLLER